MTASGASAAGWPPPPAGDPSGAKLELYKAEIQAELERRKSGFEQDRNEALHRHRLAETDRQAGIAEAAADRQVARERASEEHRAALAQAGIQDEVDKQNAIAWDAFHASVLSSYYLAYLEVAKGAIDRTMNRGQRLQEAAVAIGGLYTGVLAFLAATSEDASRTGLAVLESRALIPTVFLGGAIVCAMAHIAFLAPPAQSEGADGGGQIREDLNRQRDAFAAWAMAMPTWKIMLSQAAVVFLGLAVVFLPIGFVDVSNTRALRIAGLTAVATFAIWLLGWIVRARHKG